MSWDVAQASAWVLSSLMWTRRSRKIQPLASEHWWNNGNVHRDREREGERERDREREREREEKKREKQHWKKKTMEKWCDLSMGSGVCPCLSYFWTLSRWTLMDVRWVTSCSLNIAMVCYGIYGPGKNIDDSCSFSLFTSPEWWLSIATFNKQDIQKSTINDMSSQA